AVETSPPNHCDGVRDAPMIIQTTGSQSAREGRGSSSRSSKNKPAIPRPNTRVATLAGIHGLPGHPTRVAYWLRIHDDSMHEFERQHLVNLERVIRETLGVNVDESYRLSRGV